MARRMIDPAFWQSESIAAYPIETRFFFIGIFSNADDQGRLRGHPSILRSLIFPYDDINLDKIKIMLGTLSAEGGPLLLYRAGDRDLIQIINWWKWQHLSWAWPSDLEPPPGWIDRHCYRKGNTVIRKDWNHSDPTAVLESAQSGTTMTPERDQSGISEIPLPSNSNSGSNSGSISKATTADSGASAPCLPAAASAGGNGHGKASELTRAILEAIGMCDPGLTEMSMALLPPDAERWVGWATSQKGLTNPAGKIYKDWKLGKSPPKPRKCKNGDDSRRFLGVGTEFEAIIEH